MRRARRDRTKTNNDRRNQIEWEAMRWIDSTDLKNWSGRRDCQGHLSLAVRRLIRATCEDISHIVFPAGDSVQYEGWDGVLKAKSRTEYIPEGNSVWEFGANQKIKPKAERDYQRRTDAPLGVDRSATTFVFVTPRVWPSKDDWGKKKEDEGKWKRVRVYDARMLEEWIEQAPAVGAWLAKHLRKFPEGVGSAEDFWKEWACVTTPALTSDLVLAGRDKQVEAIRDWLKAPGALLTVQAASKEEALAFLVAAVEKHPESERENFSSRCLIAENIKSFRAASQTRNRLILVNRFEETDAIGRAVQNGHHVYLPAGPDNTVVKAKVKLPRLERDGFVSALKRMGLDQDEADKCSRDTGRSLSVLRRQLSGSGDQPKWARQETARELIPALLIGRWTEKKEADRVTISRLAGEPFETLSERLTKWLVGSDSPLYKIGDAWRLTSPIDAWFALGRYLTSHDLENLRNVALEVLGTANPALELELDKRWMASVYGKERPHSEWLREGIVQTLVLIGVFGEEAGVQAVAACQTWINGVVKDLLHEADWRRWSSLTEVLPLIAEASPASFLDAVETSLLAKEPPVMGMFSQSDEPLMPSSAHTGLLWALEELAWSPSLLGRVTVILGKLACLDPGGTLANRPANSLREIFLLWRPNTFASGDERLAALDVLLDREPEPGWGLLIDLMPRTHEISDPTYRTRWRQFSDKQQHAVTFAEYDAGVTAVLERALKYVGYDGHRWGKLIEDMPSLADRDRRTVIGALSSRAREIQRGREDARKALRDILSRHRSFPDADWALPESELVDIEKVYSALEPSDVRKRFAWLFDSHWPELPEGLQADDYEKQEESVELHRRKALRQIRDVQGIEGILMLAKEVEEPRILGMATAELGIQHNEEHEILTLLRGDNQDALVFAQGYVSRCVTRKGNHWVGQLLGKSKDCRWPPTLLINLLVALPENPDVWKQVETCGREVNTEYWKKCPAWFLRLPSGDAIHGIKQLLSVGRSFEALHIAASVGYDLPTSLLLQILENTASALADAGDTGRFRSHDIVKLFDVLDKAHDVDQTQIARLEWAYLPFLSREWSGRQPKILHRELARDPAFFAELIKWIYKPEDEEIGRDEQKVVPREIQARARLADELLTSWSVIPGSDAEGEIDPDGLLKWVNEARKLCIASRREEGGDSRIGQVLALAGGGNTDVWPLEPICHIIDKTQSIALETGFEVGVRNKRGTVTKSLFEGGRQERDLARHFKQYSEKLSIRWPRTASVLSRIAQSYEAEARSEDQRAEARDLDF